MATCPRCEESVSENQDECPKCGRNLTIQQNAKDTDAGDRGLQPSVSILRTKEQPLPNSRWYKLAIISCVVSFMLLPVISVVPDAWAFELSNIWLLGTVVISVGTLFHARETREISGWPRLYGLPYAIPGLSFLTLPVFLWARAEVQRFGEPPLGAIRVRRTISDPRSALQSVYTFTGAAVTVFITAFYIVLTTVTSITPQESTLATVITGVILAAILIALLYRRFAPQAHKEELDIAMRDFVIRLSGVLGWITLASLLYLIFVFGAGVLIGAARSLFIPAETLVELLVVGLLPLFLIPLAITFVLALRILPWLKALPIALSRAVSAVITFIRQTLTSPSEESTTDGPIGSAETTLLPTSGFAHTSVEIQTEEELDTNGRFGYEPSETEEINTGSVPSSLTYGILLILPGFFYAAASFAYYALRPDRAAELASVVPGERVLVTGLSFVGIPRFAITNAIELAGLPPETISLGLVGVIVPAALMIPGAWHLALEYEKSVYHTLQRIGGGNHLLLLWILPFVLPFLWGIRRIKTKLTTEFLRDFLDRIRPL